MRKNTHTHTHTRNTAKLLKEKIKSGVWGVKRGWGNNNLSMNQKIVRKSKSRR